MKNKIQNKPHLIHRHVLDINVLGGIDCFQLKEQITNILQNVTYPELSRICDKYTGIDLTYRVKQIEIDLGVVDIFDLRKCLSQKLPRRFETNILDIMNSVTTEQFINQQEQIQGSSLKSSLSEKKNKVLDLESWGADNIPKSTNFDKNTFEDRLELDLLQLLKNHFKLELKNLKDDRSLLDMHSNVKIDNSLIFIESIIDSIVDGLVCDVLRTVQKYLAKIDIERISELSIKAFIKSLTSQFAKKVKKALHLVSTRQIQKSRNSLTTKKLEDLENHVLEITKSIQNKIKVELNHIFKKEKAFKQNSQNTKLHRSRVLKYQIDIPIQKAMHRLRQNITIVLKNYLSFYKTQIIEEPLLQDVSRSLIRFTANNAFQLAIDTFIKKIILQFDEKLKRVLHVVLSKQVAKNKDILITKSVFNLEHSVLEVIKARVKLELELILKRESSSKNSKSVRARNNVLKSRIEIPIQKVIDDLERDIGIVIKNYLLDQKKQRLKNFTSGNIARDISTRIICELKKALEYELYKGNNIIDSNFSNKTFLKLDAIGKGNLSSSADSILELKIIQRFLRYGVLPWDNVLDRPNIPNLILKIANRDVRLVKDLVLSLNSNSLRRFVLQHTNNQLLKLMSVLLPNLQNPICYLGTNLLDLLKCKNIKLTLTKDKFGLRYWSFILSNIFASDEYITSGILIDRLVSHLSTVVIDVVPKELEAALVRRIQLIGETQNLPDYLIHWAKRTNVQRIDKGENVFNDQENYNIEVNNGLYTDSNITPLDLSEGVHVQNAGIILYWIYLKNLFSRLKLIQPQTNSFVNEKKAIRATLLLYLFVDNTFKEVPEYDLTLNKVLCGLPIEQPLPSKINIKQNERQEFLKLTSVLISHWQFLGKIDHKGFYHSFVDRMGLLSWVETNWVLRVEKKPQDVLMKKLPWSISVIKLPWMQEHMVVEW